MIFPKLNFEPVVQVEDKIRLDASLTFYSSDEVVTDVLIEPETGVGFISVFHDDSDRWFIDYAYEIDELKDVTVKVIADSGEKIKVYTQGINVLSIENDALFSNDNDLFPIEPRLKSYLPLGKNSFLYVHRKAQERIMAYLDEQRIWKSDNSRFTKQDIIDSTDAEMKDQFKQWSIYQSLLIIFEQMQVSNDDIFEEKKREYMRLRDASRNRAQLKLDLDDDGDLEIINIRTTRLLRR
jgi:hypothetical protein